MQAQFIFIRGLELVLILLVTILMSSVTLAKQLPCYKETLPVSSIIERIEQVNASNPNPKFLKDLTMMYMISSVQNTFEFCGPSKSLLLKNQDWGYVISSSSFIFWDGNVIKPSPLIEALKILNSEKPVGDKAIAENEIKRGWIYEKLGETEKALSLYEKAFNKSSKLIDEDDPTVFLSSIIPVTLDSLKFQIRIYESQGKSSKAGELAKKLNSFKKKKYIGKMSF